MGNLPKFLDKSNMTFLDKINYETNKNRMNYLNNCIKNGEIEFKSINGIEKLCIISVPIIDEDGNKIIRISIDYFYDWDIKDFCIFNIPKMFSEGDKEDILNMIRNYYSKYKFDEKYLYNSKILTEKDWS